MALWCDKYRPNKLSKLDYHKDQANQMKKLTESGDFPHLFLFGPSGAGKKTRTYAILRELFGAGVERLKLEHQLIETPSKRKIEQIVISSNYHLEVNPSDAGIYDRCVIQELIKTTATSGTLTEKHPFKIVVITEADKLTKEAQHGLRRTMEKYVSVCKLILIGESSSRVIPAIKSRCLLVRIPAPTHQEMINVLNTIVKKEVAQVSSDIIDKIALESGRNLRRAILMLETSVVEGGKSISQPQWLERIKLIAKKIIQSQSVSRLKEIRNNLFELQTHLIPSELVMRELVKELLVNCLDDSMKEKLISLAAEYEHKMRLGSKHIYHFEAFVAKFMAIYKCSIENVDFDEDADFDMST